MTRGGIYYAMAVAAALAAPGMTGESRAQTYPAKPLRLLVGSSAGGGGDIIARIIGARLAELLGRPIVIDNRGGAGGAIACEIAASAVPDGHTLLLASVGMLAIIPVLNPRVQYAPARDFQPVTLLAATPFTLIVHPSVAAKSVAELVTLAKGRPRQFDFASGGAGTGNHFTAELFKLAAGIDMVHVPFKGTGPALSSVLSGETQVMFSTLLPALPQIKAGRLRGLAVTGVQRSPAAPDLPTVAESGFAGFESTAWHSLLVPGATPKAIVTRLNAETNNALREPEIRGRLASQGTATLGGTPEQLAAYIKSETAKWTKVIRQAGIKAD